MENKNKSNIFEIVKPAGILTAICVIVTLLLAVTNSLTAEKITANAEAKAAESRTKVLTADSYVQLDEKGCVYEAKDADGNSLGVVITTEASGYGGTIKVMTGINSDQTIAGVNILEMSETPGMGAKAKEDSFLNQYKGLSTPNQAVKKDGGNIDAVSGATISSRAVTAAVNEALEISKAYLKSNSSTGGK